MQIKLIIDDLKRRPFYWGCWSVATILKVWMWVVGSLVFVKTANLPFSITYGIWTPVSFIHHRWVYGEDLTSILSQWSWYTKTNVGRDHTLSIVGVFSPLGQMLAVFFAALAAVTLWREVFALTGDIPRRHPLVSLLVIFLQSVFFLLSTVLLDAVLEFSYPHLFVGYALALVVWWPVCRSLFIRLDGAFGGKWKLAAAQFLVIQFLLIVMIVLNHKTYCAQMYGFLKPLLAAMSEKCAVRGV